MLLDYKVSQIEGSACAEERTNELMVIGEKGKSQLQRDLRSLFVGTINDTAKSRITFALVWRGGGATPGARSFTLYHRSCQDAEPYCFPCRQLPSQTSS